MRRIKQAGPPMLIVALAAALIGYIMGCTSEQREQSARTDAQQTAAAEARINEAREEALANIRSVAAETAQAAALRLSGATITQDEAEDAVAAILAEGH